MPKRTCEIDGCAEPIYRRSWCSVHYGRWRRHADPMAVIQEQSRSATGVCGVSDCDAPHRARGFCMAHYKRWKLHGDPDVRMRNRITGNADPVDHFWARVAVGNPSDCWPWQAARDQNGYGRLMWQDRIRQATHVSLELNGRIVPPGMFACHHCDNPPCVNPAHLFIGTLTDNVRDMWAKKRGRTPTVP